MSVSNVSLGGFPQSLDLFDTAAVNKEQATDLGVLTFVIILLPAVNIPIINSVCNDKSGSFLNTLIILDCLNALAHVPILLQNYK